MWSNAFAKEGVAADALGSIPGMQDVWPVRFVTQVSVKKKRTQTDTALHLMDVSGRASVWSAVGLEYRGD